MALFIAQLRSLIKLVSHNTRVTHVHITFIEKFGFD